MRSILNISLPKETALNVKRDAKQGGFATTSEYIRHLIRLENTRKLIDELKVSSQEYKKGKGKILKSLKELI